MMKSILILAAVAIVSVNADAFKGQLAQQQVFESAPAVHYSAPMRQVSYQQVAAAPVVQSVMRRSPLLKRSVQLTESFKSAPAQQIVQQSHYAAAPALQLIQREAPLIRSHYVEAALSRPLLSSYRTYHAEPALRLERAYYAEPLRTLAVQRTFAEPIKSAPLAQVTESFKGQNWQEPMKGVQMQQTFQEPIKAMPAIQQTYAEPIKSVAQETFKGQSWQEPMKGIAQKTELVQQTFQEPIKAIPQKTELVQQTFQEPIKAVPQKTELVQQTFQEPIKQLAAPQKAL